MPLNQTRSSKEPERLSLHGFNNLTKTLSFNIYDVCYAAKTHSRREYLTYINHMYNALRLERILCEVAETIGATVLNVSGQDYNPMGASVTVLLAEEPMEPRAEQVLAHLDKSHLCVHTYPESDSSLGISTFRVDVDISTCGRVSPLNALNHLIGSFDSDIVLMDYKVRGFTRDIKGKKHYIDHKIQSIQQYIRQSVLEQYLCVDINIQKENLFHTKMLRRKLELDNYLFAAESGSLNQSERNWITKLLQREMTEIFYSQNLY